jgi:hypothetical protein
MSVEFPTCPSELVEPQWSRQVSAIPEAFAAAAGLRSEAVLDSRPDPMSFRRMRSEDTMSESAPWGIVGRLPAVGYADPLGWLSRPPRAAWHPLVATRFRAG